MSSVVCFSCLVVVAVLAGVTGLPEQQHEIDNQSENKDIRSILADHIDMQGRSACGRTKPACQLSGGKCQSKTTRCEGDFLEGKQYCRKSNKCGCCVPPPIRTPTGCVYGFKNYEDGAILNDACLEFECTEGNWKYLGKSIQECGDCTVIGDPHFSMYDNHTLINGENKPYANPFTIYTVPGGFDGEFAISQQGKDIDPLFGVEAYFKQCSPGWKKNASCVSSVTYTEPGLNVELILPEKADTKLSAWPALTVFYCQEYNRDGHGAPPAPHDPLCATKIKVNGKERVIGDDGSVTSFSGTDGTVLIFKVGECNSYKCHIYVVGSNGITVSLLVDPGLRVDTQEWMYYLNVYSSPSLHNTLYGLCDTFTGELTHNYTLRDGSLMTTWTYEKLDDFIKSWQK